MNFEFERVFFEAKYSHRIFLNKYGNLCTMPLFNDNCGLLLDVNQNDICIGDLLIKSNKKDQEI